MSTYNVNTFRKTMDILHFYANRIKETDGDVKTSYLSDFGDTLELLRSAIIEAQNEIDKMEDSPEKCKSANDLNKVGREIADITMIVTPNLLLS